MINIIEKTKLYWLSIAFWVCSFFVTRGKDGHMFIFMVSFGVLAVVYCIFMPVTFKTKFTIHSIGHLIIFPAVCMLGFHNSMLDEMAGVLYLYIPLLSVIIVLSGCFFYFLYACLLNIKTHNK